MLPLAPILTSSPCSPSLLSHRNSLWSRFFCLSVYITMYLNDHSRADFYGALGLNTTQFNRHVIIETNNATARVFPEVGDSGCSGWVLCWMGWQHYQQSAGQCVYCAVLGNGATLGCSAQGSLAVQAKPPLAAACCSLSFSISPFLTRFNPPHVCNHRCLTARLPASGTSWTAWLATTRS